MSEMKKELEDNLRNSLRYTFNLDTCENTLDFEESAEKLCATGILLPSPEKFVFHDGCLSREDFYRIVGACKDIGAFIWDAPTCGFTKDGVDYIPVDIMRGAEEIEEALRTVLAFFRTVRGGR